MGRQIVYRELHGLLWVAIGVGVVSLGLLVAGSRSLHPQRGWWVLAGVVGVLVAVMVEGVHGMNCITLERDRLTVGRKSFSRSDVDGLFGVQPPLVLDPDEQERVEEQWPLPHDAAVRIAGGGWGRRVSTHMVVLRESRSQQLVAVFSRRPRELHAHLDDWLGELPDPPVGGVRRER